MRIHSHPGSLLLLAALLALAACRSKPTVAPQASTTAAAAPTTPGFENPGGMWMPEQMPLHAATLESLGLQIPASSLAKPDVTPLGAVVSLGGCTGSFVSPDGLIATNHHCVTGYLGFASTKEKDYQAAGVHARTRAEELWAGPNARVLVTRSIKDVTAEVRAGIDAIKDDAARLRAVEKHAKALVAACEEGRPEVRCHVASFFRGAEYRLTELLEMKDVRLVYVPPAGIGNFGGDIDNWRWPRHAGDFAFLRVYVGKDGKPAEHAAWNVPYEPRFHIPMASSPLRAGDLVLVAGYPGSTSRLKVAAEVEEAVTWTFPMRIESFSAFIPLLESFAARSKELKIKTSLQLQGLHNYLIKSRGIVEGFERTDGLAERRKAEAELLAFIDADPARKAAWGGAVAGIDTRLAQLRKHREHDAAVREVLTMPRLLGQAMLIVRMAEERAKPDAERDPDYQQRNQARFVDQTATFQRYHDRDVEEAVLGLALERAAKLGAGDQPRFTARLPGKATKERAKRIAAMYAGTKLEDVELRKKLLLTATTADLQKGPYVLSDIGDVPVDFLSDLDITGGNSGSPTLNARGELVGLAFDGNYEGVASDWLFMPDVTRTIHVDARYILWVLDAVAGAGQVLAELKQTPVFAR